MVAAMAASLALHWAASKARTTAAMKAAHWVAQTGVHWVDCWVDRLVGLRDVRKD
jgi:hypothetical protein